MNGPVSPRRDILRDWTGTDGEFRYLEDVKLVVLIEFNWIWTAECAYMHAVH